MTENKDGTAGNEEKAVLTAGEQQDDTETQSVGDGRVPDGTTDLDMDKVKFINGNGSADARVDMGSSHDEEFCGLTKQELKKYADDPYWVRVRWIMLIMFWLAWLGMLVAAIVIIVLAPKCPPRPELQWWQKSVIYQCYPRSFQDTNGDGVGDIKGVEKKLGYLHEINTTAVWINTMYKAAGQDLGNDIIDYKAIDPMFGTMEEMESLERALHRKNMKLIMDFVPNHTSRNHTWFKESRKGGDNNDYKDYYVWHPGKNNGNSPPNNWLSVYGSSAWTKDEERGEYYLHQFWSHEPDLNLRNPTVKEKLKEVLQFWLEKHVDGFNIVGAANLFEGNISQNEPQASDTSGLSPDDYNYLEHTQTLFQPETYKLITEWRELIDTHPDPLGNYKFLMVDVQGTTNQTMSFFEYEGKKGADLPTNMELADLKMGCNSQCVAAHVHNWISNIPENKWSNWLVGNPDRSRVATRVGLNYTNAINMLLLTLPGTPLVYYGDEIGMVDREISDSEMRDPYGIKKGSEYSRDPARTPMQWSSAMYAGFSTAKPWLPLNGNYIYKNVKAEEAHGAGVTTLEVFKNLTVLRKEPSFQWGRYEDGHLANKNIYGFVRQAEGFAGYLVAINFSPAGNGTSDSVANFHAARPDIVPNKGTIVATTGNIPHHRQREYLVGTEAPLDSFFLKPGEGVVITWPASDIPKE